MTNPAQPSSQAPSSRVRGHEALSVPSRVLLLDLLRGAGGPLDVHELGTASGLHLTTVRFHLGVLCEAGFARKDFASTTGRGRPRAVYTATHAANPGPYAALAAALAGNLAPTPDERRDRAEQAGREMAAAHAPAPGTPPATGPEALDRVVALFTELGFEPDVDGPRVRLNACPYREVAVEHPDVVCALHLGLLRGLLDDCGAPLRATDLLAFVEPALCVAVLEDRPDDR